MGRLFEKIERPAADLNRQLVGRRGPMSFPDGSPVTAARYLEEAQRKPEIHQGAAQAILGFVALDPGHPNFPAMRRGMQEVVAGYMPGPPTPRRPQG